MADNSVPNLKKSGSEYILLLYCIERFSYDLEKRFRYAGSLFVLSANGWKDQNMDSSFSHQRKPLYGEGIVRLANRVAVWRQSEVSVDFSKLISSGMRFFYPRVRLTQPKATRVCNRSINQSNRSIPFICFFCFLRAFSFQGHTKIALVHPFTSSNHEIRNKFQRTSPVSCSLDRNYV